jgi:hypothetical protein
MDSTSLCASIEASATAGGTPENAGALGGRILDAVLKLIPSVPGEGKVALRDGAMAAFRNLCKLYDIPYLVEPLESTVEGLVGLMLEQLLNRVLGLEA